LKVKQDFQPALCDFRLVWGIGGVPARILQHIAENDGRRDAGVVSRTDKGAPGFVFFRHRPQARQVGVLGFRRRETRRIGQTYGLRDDLGDQLIRRGDTDTFQHRGSIPRPWPDMPILKCIGKHGRHEYIL